MNRQIMLVALALVVALAGCGKGDDDPMLAQVGTRAIMSSDYIESYVNLPEEGRPDLSTLEGKQQFLEDLINRDLMELAALEVYPELTEQQEFRHRRFRDSQTTSLVRQKLIRDQVKITEKMKDELYRDLAQERHLLAMLIPDPGQAEFVRKELDGGGDFLALARDHSVRWVTAEGAGDAGWVAPGSWPHEFDLQVWAADPGTILGPYREAMGYLIVKVVDERPAEVADTREAMDALLDEMLMEPAYMLRQRVVLDSLRTAVGPSFPSEGQSLIMTSYYWEPSPEEAENPYARLDARRVSPTWTAEQESVIVIAFENMPDWNAAEFRDRLEWYASGIWPTGQSETELVELYDIMIRDYLWLKAGKDLGWDQDPDLLERLDRRRREMRVTYFYYNNVMKDLEITQEAIDAWFLENRDRYRANPSVKLAFFGSRDRALMEELQPEWQDGASFNEIRDKYELRDPDLEASAETPWIYSGQDAVFDDLIMALEVGGISAPFTRQDMTGVYKVVAKRGERLVNYDEIKDQVDQDAKTWLGDQHLQAFLEGKKAEFPVTIHEEALADFELPKDLSGPAGD